MSKLQNYHPVESASSYQRHCSARNVVETNETPKQKTRTLNWTNWIEEHKPKINDIVQRPCTRSIERRTLGVVVQWEPEKKMFKDITMRNMKNSSPCSDWHECWPVGSINFSSKKRKKHSELRIVHGWETYSCHRPYLISKPFFSHSTLWTFI